MQQQITAKKQRQNTAAAAAHILRRWSEQAALALQELTETLRFYHDHLKQKSAQAYRELTGRLGLTMRDLLDYVSPEATDCSPKEQAWAMSAVTAVANVIEGDDPYGSLCRMSVEERAFALESIHSSLAGELGFAPCEVIFTDVLRVGEQGYYDHTRQVLAISEHLLTAQPMSRDTARLLMTDILHESFHRFQYTAMLQPERFGISKDLARLWRDNARHYIDPHANPFAHMEQPLESYARWFAELTTDTLSDKAFLYALQLTLNPTEGGF